MSDPIAPIWFVFPIAGIAMLMTAGYLIALREGGGVLPPVRRRLRTASAWVIMVTLPITAYGFSIATTDDPRTFMLVWVTATALLAMIFLLSMIDLMMLTVERRRVIADQRKAISRARRDLLAGAVVDPISGTALVENQGRQNHAERPDEF